MTTGPWRVRLGATGRSDFAAIIRSSRKTFGARQASACQTLILEAAAQLKEGPDAPGNRKHDSLRPGLRSRRVARPGRHSAHMLLFLAVDAGTIEVLRILHERMDLARHLPPNPN